MLGMADPANLGWVKVIAAALGSGLTVKALDVAYQEIRRRYDRSASSRKFTDEALDPLLKAADELFGKLRALALRDFTGLRSASEHLEKGELQVGDLAALLYLFGKFWGRAELLRGHSMYSTLSEDTRGRELIEFLRCLESQRTRLVDRTTQRAIGESMIAESAGSRTTLSFVEFVEKWEGVEQWRRWLAPLALLISRTNHTSVRQDLLKYGVVLNVMIDRLDSSHIVTRDRAPYAAKLSKRTRKDLRFRIFKVHLEFVDDTRKYTQP